MKKTAIAVLMGVMLATGAFAHSKAEQTTPADTATVSNLDRIEIRFDDPMRVTAFSLTGPDGAVDVSRETGMEPTMEFRATPPDVLPKGGYTVEWRGLAADGHPMQGSFGFTVAD